MQEMQMPPPYADLIVHDTSTDASSSEPPSSVPASTYDSEPSAAPEQLATNRRPLPLPPPRRQKQSHRQSSRHANERADLIGHLGSIEKE
jgi:hypothetical protein